MSENKLSYLNKNFNDYRNSIIDITKKYYPDVFENLNDASIGQWLIDILSDMGDNLNYHLDKSLQETNLETATEFGTLMDIARTNGLHIPYKKAAMVEIELSCNIPLYTQGSNGDGNMMADERYCPYIKRGSKFSNGTATFELIHDIDFKEEFDENGFSNRQIIPNRNSNGTIVSYTYKKLGIATAAQSRVLKRVITENEITPFMEVIIDDNNVIGVDSIILKDGINNNTDPEISEFFVDKENYFDKLGRSVVRYFEVDNLLEQKRFGYDIYEKGDGTPIRHETNKNNIVTDNYYNPIWEDVNIEYNIDNKKVVKGPVSRVVRGKWKRLKRKFITEYTNDWQLKIIFGAGINNRYGKIPDNATDFTKYQMSRMYANDYMGVLPEPNKTMYILYQIGGGEISNIAAHTLNSIISLNLQIGGNCEDANDAYKINMVRSSISVTNTTPSYGGKDAPTAEEIKYLIKYNTSAQNRCVTLKDYIARINEIPARYGIPFRYSAIEENNKIVLYTLGLNERGELHNFLAEQVAENIKKYLSNFKMLNDFIEIKSGKIINLAFRLVVYVEKSYNKAEVVKNVIDKVYDYMDIRKRQMGEDIFIGDLQKEISQLDGIINLTSLRIFNKIGEGYSEDGTNQPLVTINDCNMNEYEENEQNYEQELYGDNEIDLKASDYMLFSESNSMFEIKNKSNDITVIVKTRN